MKEWLDPPPRPTPAEEGVLNWGCGGRTAGAEKGSPGMSSHPKARERPTWTRHRAIDFHTVSFLFASFLHPGRTPSPGTRLRRWLLT